MVRGPEDIARTRFVARPASTDFLPALLRADTAHSPHTPSEPRAVTRGSGGPLVWLSTGLGSGSSSAEPVWEHALGHDDQDGRDANRPASLSNSSPRSTATTVTSSGTPTGGLRSGRRPCAVSGGSADVCGGRSGAVGRVGWGRTDSPARRPTSRADAARARPPDVIPPLTRPRSGN
jgi:hypothetical protein